MGMDSLNKNSIKKKKKKDRKSKKSKKHRKRSTSSSSSESNGNEWVEKEGCEAKKESSPKPSALSSIQRDDWMSVTSLIPCVTRDQLRAAKEPTKKQLENEEKKKMLDCPGQSGRELNPYWANGGKGLPPEAPGTSQETASRSTSTVTVGNSNWYKKALQRAKEQAEVEGRPLEDVAAERWGSLEKLLSMIDQAEKQEASKADGDGWKRSQEKRYERDNRHSSRGERRDDRDNKRYDKYSNRYDKEERGYDKDEKYASRRHFDSDRKSLPAFRKPDLGDDGRSSPPRFRRPNLDQDCNFDKAREPLSHKPSDSHELSTTLRYRNPPTGTGNWRKKEVAKPAEPKPRVLEKEPTPPTESSSESETEQKPVPQVLSDAQLNKLAAKLVKAEILGNDSLAADLKQKLQSAREARKRQPADAAAADKGTKEEIVILSKTDSKGFSRPLETKGAVAEPYGGRRRKQKVDTHSADGQRARYFPDDDKYSLQEMFQKEKATTVEDDREMFARLAGRDKRGEHDLDMDDIFAERARESVSDGKLEARERDRAIREHKRINKVLDNCQWCFDNKSSLKNLIISIGSVSYICLPAHESLTEGHCFVAPIRHVSCATQLDEDVWQEMQDFRKALVKMFSDRGDDCVWFESAMNLHKQPHMVWNCVPVPRESGDVAPIYFKKAILECETEWSTNKKLVDLGGRDIRKAVPKGLPYFAVDFGMQSGFAHVIEDEKQFPTNFAQEIIGGVLELESNVWRKPRRESFEVLTKKVNSFIKEWTPYDITKKGKKRKKDRSDSSSSSSSD